MEAPGEEKSPHRMRPTHPVLLCTVRNLAARPSAKFGGIVRCTTHCTTERETQWYFLRVGATV
jgi:hypothetical protein